MKEYLKNALPYIALFIVLSAIGVGIEWYRRRGLQRWAYAQGGTFEAGTLLEGTKVPEAAPFDAGADPTKVTYSNVSRIPKPEASYVLAQYEHRYKDFKDQQKTFSCVVCFITLPGVTFPEAHVSPAVRFEVVGFVRGVPATPPITVPDAVPGFADSLRVAPMSGPKEIKPEALSGLLSKDVQQILLEKRDVVSGLQVRGNVVRLQAVHSDFGYPHREVFNVAQKLVAIWTSSSR